MVNSLTEFITCPRKMANVEVWGIAQIPHHISTGIAPSCFSLDKTRKRFDNFETKTTRKSDVKMEDNSNMLGTMGSTTHQQNSPQPSPTRKIESAVINKSTSSGKKAKAGNTKVKAVSKKRVSRIIDEDGRWRNDIISRVIQFEMETGFEPGLLDLMCRFSSEEIDTVWSDLLWLYPDLCSKGPVKIEELEVMG
jgi:hypothetical protein